MLQTNILLFMILFIYNCSSILMYEIYNLQHMKFKGLFNLCIFFVYFRLPNNITIKSSVV